jgi:hypothetical protein
VHDVFQRAKEEYPEKKFIEKALAGTTFVTLTDAMKLQHSMRSETSFHININYKREEICKDIVGIGELVIYQPYWPTNIVNIHPYNEHGAEPVILPQFKCSNRDCRLLWMVATMHSTIDVVWEMSAQVITDNSQWMGWLLQWLTWSLFPSKGTSKKLFKNPFPVQKTAGRMREEVIHHFYGEDLDPLYNLQLLQRLFEHHEKVDVVEYTHFLNDFSSKEEYDVVIVFHDSKDEDTVNFDVNNFNHRFANFDLRFLVFSEESVDDKLDGWSSTGFVRHGGNLFTGWWKVSSKLKGVEKVNNIARVMDNP